MKPKRSKFKQATAPMPAQPTQDTGAAPAVMPGTQPMSTPTPPGIGAAPPAKMGSTPAGAPFARGTNPDNLLPPAAFHKR